MFERKYERKVKKMSEIEGREQKWLWEPYIPYGAVTVLHGERSVGKSLMTAKLMGYCTNRQPITDGDKTIEPGKVLLLSGEEELSFREKRRQLDAGVDPERVFVINDRMPLRLGDNSLEEIVRENRIKLLIIDPIQEYLESDDGMSDDFNTYPVIKKLAGLAKSADCAIVLVTASEDMEGNEVYSWDDIYHDCVYSILRLENLPDNSNNRKVLIHEKSLLTVEGVNITYELNKEKGLTEPLLNERGLF